MKGERPTIPEINETGEKTDSDFLKDFLEYVRENGKNPERYGDKNERSLYAWLKRVRKKHKDGELDDEDEIIIALKGVDIKFYKDYKEGGERISDAIARLIHEYKRFKLSYPDKEPSRVSNLRHEKRLAERIKYYRELYRGGRLNKKYINKLVAEGVVMFPEQKRKKRAIEDARKIIDFIKNNKGKKPSRVSADDEERRLYRRLRQFRPGYEQEFLRLIGEEAKDSRRLDKDVMLILLKGGAFYDSHNMIGLLENRGMKKIDEEDTLNCKVKSRNVNVKKCGDDYLKANAFSDRDSRCFNCKTGKKIREIYSANKKISPQKRSELGLIDK